MREAWNKVIYKIWAPVYDRFFNAGIFRKARMELFQENKIQNRDQVLLVGVGTGADLEYIHHTTQSITAIDFSPEMLQKAKEKYPNSSIQFLEMDAQNMSFDDHSFDVVIGSLILSVVPDPGQCFQEMERVLKPEGQIIIFDKFISHKRNHFTLQQLFRPVIKVLGTDVGLSFEELYQKHRHDIAIEEDKPMMLAGMYRKIILRK
ncbi:class I SAM-dependent methyltransferase [Pontibacillus marinus]|uniref:Phosphatidylethanolamine N-methyltransferase n=1 Tax=Pontibacillus marinus BH030004 = DSM 16465 TaxID=1385511 RepID=A0A0A5FVQ5_9BACI|nr:class I SAM-dependent methyltransferase [Pontibacillus marinus]KGX84881.1 phosphatidylethanolamine N-methyltransferase [Pontibacillus marinus BH030004 = DSM 16465]